MHLRILTQLEINNSLSYNKKLELFRLFFLIVDKKKDESRELSVSGMAQLVQSLKEFRNLEVPRTSWWMSGWTMNGQRVRETLNLTHRIIKMSH